MSGFPALPRLLRRPVLFPDRYAWYVLVCFLDLIVTNTILAHFGGIEVNGIAHRVIELGGFGGLIAFKCASVVLVVTICEVVGRRREPLARRVSEWAIAISAIPVVVGLLQIPFETEHVEPRPRAQLLVWIQPD